jgi:hypothetical protein
MLGQIRAEDPMLVIKQTRVRYSAFPTVSYCAVSGGIGSEVGELRSCTVGITAFNVLFIFMCLILLLPVLSVSVILRASQYKLSRQYQ